jgi:hypothetical protein
MKKFIKQFLPYGIVKKYQINKLRLAKKAIENNEPEKKNENLALINNLYEKSGKGKFTLEVNDELYYESLIRRLVVLGIPESQVREGSIPYASMHEIDQEIQKTFKGKVVVALHIGNFVGVSLCFITRSILRYTDPKSLVISIDPNLTHRGVSNPGQYINKLLADDGLDSNSMIICGYSLQKSISNDGSFYGTDYNPFNEFNIENAPQNTILNLSKISKTFIDLVLIDGNHEASYLKNEIDNILPLLRDKALIVLDDIDPKYWEELYALYQNIDKNIYKVIKENNRIAILEYNHKL